jgi:dipeptidyl aminopeptidase/acylaminoacyl peptidase
MRISTVMCCLFSLACAPLCAAPTLEQIMADPDWIGPPVEQAWLGLDDRHAYYRIKKAGSPLRELRRIDLASGGDVAVSDEMLADADAGNPVFDRERRRALFVRSGDLFLRDLTNGRLHQLTRGVEAIADPRFGTDGRILVRQGDGWLTIDPATGLGATLVDLRFEDDPLDGKKDDVLRDTQLRLFETLRRMRSDRQAERDEDLRLRTADGSRGAAPWYLGKDVTTVMNDASPDGRWLLLATQPGKPDRGDAGKMPMYVTESGYTEIEDVRSRVGRNTPVAQSFELLDLRNRARIPIDTAALPGIKDDPLSALRVGDKSPKAPDTRALTLLGSRWSEDGRYIALQLRSVDNKDRWLVTIEPGRDPKLLTVQHRLSDPAWINWSFNEFGWMPDNRSLWYLSEETGFSHLYVKPVTVGGARAITQGEWEVASPELGADGSTFWFIGNAGHPSEFDLYRTRRSGAPERMTTLAGVESFVLSVDGSNALIVHSDSYTPAQLATLSIRDRQLRKLTDTRTAAYREIEWPALEIVPVPSSHQDRPVWSKLYRPARMEPGKRYPAVLFVHGAGYTQNTHRRFPYYFREQMFHHLLVERGFVVLDMDYRASAGYGRDWRTAIYQRMGHPELEDLVDGVDWLAKEYQVDTDRVGVYGGSYGGFMTLMAMFREPDRFAAGAALRPVTDWRHYNHSYTANILNTPDLDPEAHRISSPIEYAEGLRGDLLIAHGMLDDNVFYQDSVMLAQRLIELKKETWELASYPLERHSYVHAESWLDQYRRILKLFETSLSP